MSSEAVPQYPHALTLGDVFPFQPPRDRKPLCRVECDDWLPVSHRRCDRVLVDGRFKEKGEGRLELRFDGFPAGPRRELERLRITETAATAANRSRPHLVVLHRDRESVEIRCKCGAKHRIYYERVTELFFEKWLDGARPMKVYSVVIRTSEL